MCGIAGIIYLDGRSPSTDVLTSMASLLRHRGPNGSGITVQGPVGLAHSRLAILDLTESGKQPMSYDNGRYWITFNGEIYNFLEIREQLEQKKHRFNSDSDTEVILAAFSEWGQDAVNKFLGMFAFAIWDNKERSLYLYRDRFGVKPLHYYYDGKILAFASEIKGLLAIPEIELDYHEQNITTILGFTKYTEGLEITPFNNVSKVMPGFRITFTLHDNRLVKHRWWRLVDELPEVSPLPKKQLEEFSNLLTDACRIRMRSDVPIGICLSGGLDSSSVFGVASEIKKTAAYEPRISSEPPTTFIMRLSGVDNEEQVLAESFARKSNARVQMLNDLLHENQESEDDTALFYRMIYDFEGIDFLFPSQWKLYQSVQKSGVRVTLDGHGADECLGGYSFYAKTLGADAYETLNYSSKTLSQMTNDPNAWSDFAQDRNFPDMRGNPQFTQYQPSFAHTPISEVFCHTTPEYSPPDTWIEDEKELAGSDNIFREMYFYATGGYLQWILRAYDQASMSHGVESRAPFLDHRLFSYALALPTKSKFNMGFGKYILRESMRGLVPENIRGRGRKIGLSYPIDHWMSDRLQCEATSIIESTEFADGYPWDGRKVLNYANNPDVPSHEKMRTVFPLIQAHALKQTFHRMRSNVLQS